LFGASRVRNIRDGQARRESAASGMEQVRNRSNDNDTVDPPNQTGRFRCIFQRDDDVQVLVDNVWKSAKVEFAYGHEVIVSGVIQLQD
jgi:hypothetical protein